MLIYMCTFTHLIMDNIFVGAVVRGLLYACKMVFLQKRFPEVSDLQYKEHTARLTRKRQSLAFREVFVATAEV